MAIPIGRWASAVNESRAEYRSTAGLVPILALLACSIDRPTAPDLRANAGSISASSAAATGSSTCPACTFGPQSYTRTTGQPVTAVSTFAGNPAAAYIIEINDHGSQGANATVVLNGRSLDARSGHFREPISLQQNNQLQTRLTGKPGSTLEISIFQEVHSVTVTPNLGLTRMPATQQFVAVAGDANGEPIPNQTFEWQSSNATIATIGASSGLATTTGAVNSTLRWNYNTISPGEGPAQITARAIGTEVQGSVPWRISAGFVYNTFRAPLPLASPNRSSRPSPVPLRYDPTRLITMRDRCNVERNNEQWQDFAGGVGEILFFQCFPTLELTNLHVVTILGVDFYDRTPNVGLYGRYCGAGHPGEDFYHHHANAGNYQPKDPIDAICMEHDAQEDNHELSTSDPAESVLALCIVRYGIESERLFEDGVRILPGSTRWNVFWNSWQPMAVARQHFLDLSRATCTDDATLPGGGTVPGPYSVFLFQRGLTPP